MSVSSKATKLSALALFLSMAVILKGRLEYYRQHQVGVTVTKEISEAIPFPAVSVCTRHYDIQGIHDDIGIPRHPFRPQALSWRSDPAIAYGYVGQGRLNFSHFLHTYYTMPSRLFFDSRVSHTDFIIGCMVGGALCEVSNEDLTQWSGETNGTMEINVSNKEIFSFCLFLIAAEPSVPRTVVVVLLVVGGSSLSEHSIAFCNAVL